MEKLIEMIKKGIVYNNMCFESCLKENYFDKILYRNKSDLLKNILNDLEKIKNK